MKTPTSFPASILHISMTWIRLDEISFCFVFYVELFFFFYHENNVLEKVGCLESQRRRSTRTLQCFSALTQGSQIIICPLWNLSTPLRQLDRDQMDRLPCQRRLLSQERNDWNLWKTLWLTAQSLLFLILSPLTLCLTECRFGLRTKDCTDIDVFSASFSSNFSTDFWMDFDYYRLWSLQNTGVGQKQWSNS